MGWVPFSKNLLKRGAALGALGLRPEKPLSAQAQTPRRPSGAGKEQDFQNKGGVGRGHLGPPTDRATIAAHRHAETLIAGRQGRKKW
jgi:hypothetical protein